MGDLLDEEGNLINEPWDDPGFISDEIGRRGGSEETEDEC